MNTALICKVETVNGENTVSSRVIAEQLGKQHSHVCRDLEKILENPNMDSLIKSSFYQVEGQTRKYKEYLLTKDGFTLYMFNIQGHIDFKMAYINRFNLMEKILKEKNSTEWLQSRQNGKLTRRRETDVIQTHLIPLAIEQGSKNYKMFYANYSTLVNKSAQIENGMRDKCTREMLCYIEFVESLIESTIIEEVEKGTYYKDIYQVCKNKVELIKQVKGTPRQKYLEDLSLAD